MIGTKQHLQNLDCHVPVPYTLLLWVQTKSSAGTKLYSPLFSVGGVVVRSTVDAANLSSQEIRL